MTQDQSKPKGPQVRWISEMILADSEDIICETEKHTENFPNRYFVRVVEFAAIAEAMEIIREMRDGLSEILKPWDSAGDCRDQARQTLDSVAERIKRLESK